MYSYTYDIETGGILLNTTPTSFSKEPRPVYSLEMDLLGFNKYWQYKRQDKYPYLWAEANYYWYRGKKVAKIIGGNLYEKPDVKLEIDENNDFVLPKDSILKYIDTESMVKKNSHILDLLQKSSETRILNYYKRYQKKIDCFYVAFSGGKDSMVLLDLTRRILPQRSFKVIFGDTGMEFPDTYTFIDIIEEYCKKNNIHFYTAKSHLDPKQSWHIFGPPASTMRWCCSVHKSAPQIIKLREISGKKNCIGMAFVGIREYESNTRSKYNFFNYGKKQKGQYALLPILEWSSAEIWLYIYYKNLPINNAYKKGNSRIGCLCCPKSTNNASAWFRRINYTNDYDEYISIIKETINKESQMSDYIKNSGWVQRYSGVDLFNTPIKHNDYITSDYYIIEINSYYDTWFEWIKTLPNNIPIKYDIIDNKLIIKLQIKYYNTEISKYLRYISYKIAYCVQCGTCEANCPHGAISFNGNKLHIDNCIKCGFCYKNDDGCIYYRSIRQPKFGKNNMNNLNQLEDYDLNSSWFYDFFKIKNIKDIQLGPNKVKILKRFLKTATLIDKNCINTDFFNFVLVIGIESLNSWELILINLAQNNPQFNFYIKKLPLNSFIDYDTFYNLLPELPEKSRTPKHLYNTFIKLSHTQFGDIINFATSSNDNSLIRRTKPYPPDPRVFLYGLYKFAEACDGYYEITLSRLMDYAVESKGISPTEIFGFDRDEAEQYLRGLAQNYPEFVPSFSTTHGLELLNLNPEKSSGDVLSLFQ